MSDACSEPRELLAPSAPGAPPLAPVMRVRDLSTVYAADDEPVQAVREVSLDLVAGEALCLVGESGCGKSAIALSIMRLLPSAGRIVGGSVELDGVDLLAASPRELRALRGRRVAMVFQDSMTSLNPLLTVERQLVEGLVRHMRLDRRAARARALELLEEVGVPDPARRLKQYPHQLSGGLRQRVAIAIALAPNPQVLIADEPTTALDVTVQAQILELLRSEQRERRMALLLITHDLGVVAGVADRVAVMYAGRIVEQGGVEDVFRRPRHPYTLGLLRSVPAAVDPDEPRLPSIPGAPPIGRLPCGCAFRERCAYALDRCAVEDPPLEPVGAPGQAAACWADVAEAGA